MLSLDDLLTDPLLQVWDVNRVLTAMTRSHEQRRQRAVQRWFFFNSRA
jgi:hypothetical protein